MEALRGTEKGLILSVKIIPKAGKEEIVGLQENRLKIKVGAPPEKGEANAAVIRLLAKILDIPQSRIILVRGATSRNKDFLLHDCDYEAILNKLKKFL